MKTVKEVSRLTGVSIRTLHYYDSIGLLRPTQVTESGYRLYDETALERLQYILLFRELRFSLKEINGIMSCPSFDRNQALDQQIKLLQLQKEHIENLIDLARGIQMIGVQALDFSAFDTQKIDDYTAQAKAVWGKTEAYREFEEKDKARTKAEQEVLSKQLIGIFQEFGAYRDWKAEEASVQELVRKLRQFINDHFYTCTPEILRFLGKMYAGGGSMTDNIDKSCGEGTADFAASAICYYCESLGAKP